MHTKLVFFIWLIGCLNWMDAQELIEFEDNNFKQCLLNRTAIDQNGDGEVQVIEANAFSSPLRCEHANIYSIDGIQYFTNLRVIDIGGNHISSVDFSSNILLERIDLHSNDLVEIDVSPLLNLKKLELSDNNLSSLNVENNLALDTLHAAANDFSGYLEFSNPNIRRIGLV